MRKFLLLVLVAFVSSTMSAQLVTSTTLSREKKEAKGGMFMEIGVGALGGDYENDGVALDLGLGYRKVYNPYVAWDVLKLKALAEVANLGETITPQLMTGIRGTTPVLFGNMSLYGSFSGGYGYVIDLEDGGFAYEAQVGINLTPKIYAGFVYANQSLSDYEGDVSFTAVRFGLRF